MQLSALIQSEISSVTGLPVAELGLDAPFASFGIESLQAVTIAANVSARLGRDVPVTLFFDYPTIQELSAFLAGGTTTSTSRESRASNEPVAIVGLACRFPGAPDLEKFWYNLSFGKDAIGETPPNRWDWRSYPELPALRWGGFLTDIDSFDHEMFGISEPEAARMDPQQKVLLECVHEAIESAHLVPRDLQRSRTGVFIGISSSDHSVRQARAGKTANVFDATGNAHSIAANRISYLYNLKGPSLSLDTACSSSLVAFHEACKSLQAGDCDLAIVGGVNILLEPEISRAFAEAGMLAPDGRCKTFSKEANGYVRGEGAGVVLLQRLRDAEPRRVFAVAKGSAVNHDGKTNGLTAPSGVAQEEVIREALTKANLCAEDIHFVEAHGTGTALGDPIEFLTLARVFGGREKDFLRVGSAKAFVGHLEAAAGVCGVIKAALSLRYRSLPRQLHYREVNPKMESALGSIRVADEPTTFAPEAGPLRAGISSFGFGGTNAHVILESPPALPPLQASAAGEGEESWILAFSATERESLREFSARWLERLSVDEPRAAALVKRSAAERLEYGHRLVCWGRGRDEVLGSLQAWQRGDPSRWAERHQSRAFRARTAFAFTGQGSQYTGMGQELLGEKHFRSLWRETLAELDAHFPEPLLEVCRNPSLEGLLFRTDYGQALLFSLECALADFLEQSWGIVPEVTFGHSLGEISAAAFAGALSRRDACRLVAARGILMQEATAEGGMLSVRGKRSEVEEVVRSTPGLEWAAFNGPELFTLAGPRETVEEGRRRLEAKGLQPKPLAVTRAFHSALMDSMREPFARVLGEIQFLKPRLPLLSSLTGKFVGEGEYGVNYWLRQLREPTQFQGMVESAVNFGVNTFVEVGPHPVISVMGPACAPDSKLIWVPTLKRGAEGQWLRALAELTALGARRVRAPLGAEPLPATPFGHRLIRSPEVTMNLVEELRALVAGLLQVKPEEVDPESSLVDLGADSLLLLNAIQTIKERHGVSIAVADLFRDLNNLRAIAAYVEANKPRPAVAAAERKSESVASPLPPSTEDLSRIARTNREAVFSTVAGSDLQAIIAGQIALMNQQLALLSGTAPAGVTVAGPGTVLPGAVTLSAATSAAPAPASPSAAATEAKGVLGNWRSRANREVSGEEKARQAYIEKFIQRFNARTKNTKQHTQRYRQYLADNRVSAGFRPNLKEMIYTIVFQSGKGSRFRDIDGNEYLDFTMGFGVNLFGHCPDFIEKRIRAQLDQGYCVGPQAELAGVVAEKACKVLGHERVAFLNSGTEAVMTAIRLARTVTGRNRVVLFEGSYHGHADVVLARSGEGGKSLPVAPGVPTGIVGDVVVLPYGEQEALEYIRAHGTELAAVLVEPVQSRYPEHQPVAFLKEIRALTEKSGTAFIFDEVICGLRVAPGGAEEIFGIRPDLAAYGKVLGGGMPIGAVAGRARFLDPIDGGYWKFGDDSYPGAEMTFFAGTFCKHPVTMAAAEAVLDRFQAEGGSLTTELNERTAKLCARLNAEFAGLDLQANHFGSLFRFKSHGNLDIFFANLNLRGAYVWEGRNLFLSTAHTDEDLDEFVRIVRETIAELKPEGFLRKKP